MLQVRLLSRAPRTRSPTVEALALGASQCRFESDRVYHNFRIFRVFTWTGHRSVLYSPMAPPPVPTSTRGIAS